MNDDYFLWRHSMAFIRFHTPSLRQSKGKPCVCKGLIGNVLGCVPPDSPFVIAVADPSRYTAGRRSGYQLDGLVRRALPRNIYRYFCRSIRLRAPRSGWPVGNDVAPRPVWYRNDSRYRRIPVPCAMNGAPPQENPCHIVWPSNELQGGWPPCNSGRNNKPYPW